MLIILFWLTLPNQISLLEWPYYSCSNNNVFCKLAYLFSLGWPASSQTPTATSMFVMTTRWPMDEQKRMRPAGKIPQNRAPLFSNWTEWAEFSTPQLLTVRRKRTFKDAKNPPKKKKKEAVMKFGNLGTSLPLLSQNFPRILILHLVREDKTRKKFRLSPNFQLEISPHHCYFCSSSSLRK